MLRVDTADMDRKLNAVLDRLSRQPTPDLVRAVGDEVRFQIQHRIENEKRDPDGKPWRPWSDVYAKTRGPQHSLLIDTGDLLESIETIQRGNAVQVGSSLVYARKQDAAREFVGLGADGEEDLLQVIGLFLEREIRRA